jgi:hypothetical protein
VSGSNLIVPKVETLIVVTLPHPINIDAEGWAWAAGAAQDLAADTTEHLFEKAGGGSGKPVLGRLKQAIDLQPDDVADVTFLGILPQVAAHMG